MYTRNDENHMSTLGLFKKVSIENSSCVGLFKKVSFENSSCSVATSKNQTMMIVIPVTGCATVQTVVSVKNSMHFDSASGLFRAQAVGLTYC